MQNSLQLYDLQCEYAVNPIGIDAQNPRFSWKINAPTRGTVQTAYRIVAASSPNGAADKWDSGTIYSSRQTGIEYNGKELTSGEICYWGVTVWDNHGGECYLGGASFETGLLRKEDWQGCFIGFPAWEQFTSWFFRRDFTLDKKCVRARAYIAVPGYFELFVNGRKIGDHVLDPGTTDYTKTLLYVTHDITPALLQGENALTVLTGNGWYKNQRFLLQCNFYMEDGTIESFCSESSDEWFGAMSPISYNDIYGGEHYDTRFEHEDWLMPGNAVKEKLTNRLYNFVARNLPPPESDYNYHEIKDYFFSRFRPLMLPPPGGKLRAQSMEPIKIMAEVIPVAVTNPEPGIYVFDMGENMAGWISIRVKGAKNSVVELKFAEIIYENGLCNRESLRLTRESHDIVAHDRYVLRGEGEETFEPRFTYHGFRYVQVEGLSFVPDLDTLTGKKVRSSVKTTGSFNCSDELLNKIHANAVRTEACNIYSIPTDCPQRDERHGWLNDMTSRIYEAVNNFGMNLFYEKWVRDISDTQDPVTGAIGDTAPFRRGLKPSDPMCSSYLLTGWMTYVYYGNTRVLADNYEGFVKWARYLETNSVDDIVNFAYWSDWCQPIKFCWYNGCISKVTPGELISTAYCYHNFDLLEKMAKVLGKNSDEAGFRQTKERIKAAFNKNFYDPVNKCYSCGDQASNAVALYAGLVPEEDCPAIARLIADNMAENEYHFTTGNLCTVHAAIEGSAHGGIDAVFKCMTAEDYPSFGYQIGLGATTVWERWEHLTGNSMNSHNHPMFGSTDAWFYRCLGGIKADEENAAFGHCYIAPAIPDGLEFAETSIETVRGTLKSAWKKTADGVEYMITIPANASATLIIQTPESGFNEIKLGSGEYKFVTEP